MMKKITLLFFAAFSMFALCGTNTTYGFSIVKPAPASEPASLQVLRYLNARDFVNLSVKDYTALTGKKLNFFQRLSFKVTKMKMKHDLKKNPNLTLTDYIDADGSTTFKIDILWLLLGLILPVIGVLIAYLTKQEKYKITSAWIGLGAFLIVALVFGHVL